MAQAGPPASVVRDEPVAHCARTATGRLFHTPGFDHVAHDRYVAAGGCPVVQSSGLWCALRAGHPAAGGEPWRDHASKLITPDGVRLRFWAWP